MMEFTRLIYSIIVLEVIFFCDSGVEPAGVFNILQDPMNLVKQAEKIITDARETFPTKIVNNIQPQTKPIDFNVVTEVQENENKLETRSDTKPEEISNYVHHEFEIKGGGIQKIKLYTGPDLSGVSGELLGRYCWDLRRCFEVTLDNSVSSVLVTGLEPGFKGSSGCVYPPGGGTPKMLATPDVIGMEQIGSAKIGCHSRKILPQVQKSTASLKTSPLNYPIFPPFAVNLRGASPLQEFDENAATEKKNKTSNKK
ncbi:unnamed protein product [Notodromas monacha]|uniref:Uncharacterized protein n=1 Tax=Notodromas monacha TaxID=399045 RepID=A0A7R9BYL2_9CRUS|nr:unnamed protein product [Notodromas monacha]CAG0922819.1 unnamed protein product [Notodromas monacha]